MDNSSFDQQWMHETTLHPIALVILVVACIATLFASRRAAVMAMLFVACFVSPGQNLVVFGASLYLLRILTLIGIVRVLVRGEAASVRPNLIDAMMLLWFSASILAYTAQQQSFAGFKFVAGQGIDSAGAYFVFRCLFKGIDDLKAYIRWQSILAIPVAIAFIYEYSTRYNVFSIFGGVPEVTEQRQGVLRCQGAFAHPILAGTFWASVLPLLIGSWWVRAQNRVIGAVGLICSMMIIVLCASSTPLLGVIACGFGLALFPFRSTIKAIRWASLVLLIGLHFVMQSPLWSVLARIKIVAGSTGYYRYQLVDAAIAHVDDWWLCGMASNASWSVKLGHYLTDITSQYILEALRGGLLTLGLFVGMIWFCFKRVGFLTRTTRNRGDQILLWCLGVTLAVHAICFIAVSYFGQIVMLFNLHLALIAAMPLAPTRRKAIAERTHTEQLISVPYLMGETQYG